MVGVSHRSIRAGKESPLRLNKPGIQFIDQGLVSPLITRIIQHEYLKCFARRIPYLMIEGRLGALRLDRRRRLDSAVRYLTEIFFELNWLYFYFFIIVFLKKKKKKKKSLPDEGHSFSLIE